MPRHKEFAGEIATLARLSLFVTQITAHLEKLKGDLGKLKFLAIPLVSLAPSYGGYKLRFMWLFYTDSIPECYLIPELPKMNGFFIFFTV